MFPVSANVVNMKNMCEKALGYIRKAFPWIITLALLVGMLLKPWRYVYEMQNALNDVPFSVVALFYVLEYICAEILTLTSMLKKTMDITSAMMKKEHLKLDDESIKAALEVGAPFKEMKGIVFFTLLMVVSAVSTFNIVAAADIINCVCSDQDTHCGFDILASMGSLYTVTFTVVSIMTYLVFITLKALIVWKNFKSETKAETNWRHTIRTSLWKLFQIVIEIALIMSLLGTNMYILDLYQFWHLVHGEYATFLLIYALILVANHLFCIALYCYYVYLGYIATDLSDKLKLEAGEIVHDTVKLRKKVKDTPVV